MKIAKEYNIRFLILELERDVAVLTLAGGPELRLGVGVEAVVSQAASRKGCGEAKGRKS